MKAPAFLFYTGDWLKDPNLGMCSPATRGIWIDLISAMYENGNSGEIKGTPEQLSRICRCTTDEFLSAVDELKKTNTAEVKRFCNGNVTLLKIQNRRMSRKAKLRENQRVRVFKHRSKEKCNASVTDLSRNCNALSSFSSSSSRDDNIISDHNDCYISVTLKNLDYSHFQAEFQKLIDQAQSQEANPVDWKYYLEKFLKPGLANPVQYFRKCMQNEPRPLKTIKQPPQKKFSIPAELEIVEGQIICLNCHNHAQKVKNPQGLNGLFCEYCGHYEEETPPEIIHEIIQEVKEKIKEVQNEKKLQTIGE